MIKHLITKNPKFDGYQRRLASVVHNFFYKKTSGGAIKNEPISKKKLVEKLHKSIIRKFEKWKVHSLFIDNISGTDLTNMQLINKLNKRFRFLLYVINIYSKYAWVIPLKDKEGITIGNALQKTLHKLNHKPNKIWIEKGSKFYNRSMKSLL